MAGENDPLITALRASLRAWGEVRTVTIVFDGGPLDGQTRSVTTSGGLPLAPSVVPVQPGPAWREQPVYFPTRERDAEGRYVYRLSDIKGNPSWLRNPTIDVPWPRVADDQPPDAIHAWRTGGDTIVSVQMPSATERRKAAREDAVNSVGFNFGFFFVVLPFSTLATVALAAASRLVTPVEALVSLAVSAIVILLLWEGDNGNRLGMWLWWAIVGGMTKVVGMLAPVPILGLVAEWLGATMILWLPVAILAVVSAVI